MNMTELHEGGILIKYRSPQWALILESYMGMQSAILGICGLPKSGPLGAFMHNAHMAQVWGGLFCLLGLGLFITTIMEMVKRTMPRKDCSWRRYSQVREVFAAALVPCWMCGFMLFIWSDYTLVLVPALSLQSLCAMGLVLWENINAQHNPKIDRRATAAVAGHSSNYFGPG